MTRQEILAKCANDEDRLLISKLFDKIEFVSKRNSIEYTDFLDMRQRQLLEKVINEIKYTNYVVYGAFKTAERTVLILYPSKLEDVFNNDKFDYNSVFSIIRIKLPNELKGMYSHRNYLGAIMKLGVEREKVGDILVEKEGAYIIIEETVEKFLMNQLPNLTRFAKAKIENIPLNEIKIPERQMQEKTIIVSSMRIDNIVAELAKCSRKVASAYIQEERVFINHEIIKKDFKEVKEKDKITIRGKGRFIIEEKIRKTKKVKIFNK